MIVTNSFRFGEISRKQAGRFSEEGYQQGSFQFKNARTMYDNGMARRYPLRTDAVIDQGTEIYAIHGFNISDTESFVVALGVEKDTTTDSVIIIYRYDGSSFEEVARLRNSSETGVDSDDSVSNDFIFCRYSTETDEYTPVELTREICMNVRFAQYYNRLYIVSHKFRTIYIELVGDVFSANVATFIFNQDAKDRIYFATYRNGNYEGVDTGNAKKGLVLFKFSDGRFYKDIEGKELFVQTPEYNIPEKADEKYISDYGSFPNDTDLNTDAGTYPSVVAVIRDSLYFANTEQKRSTVWKSRPIGHSQWLADYSSDTMHDFTLFQVVASSEETLMDSSEWPLTQTGYYESVNGVDAWYEPTRNADGKYTYANRLIREYKDQVIYGDGKLYFDEVTGGRYRWNGISNNPVLDVDVDKYYYTVTPDSGVKEKRYLTYVKAKDLNGENPFVNSRTNGDAYDVNDFIWYRVDANGKKTVIYKDSFLNNGTDDDTFPIRKAVTTYDLSNENALFQTHTTIDFVATDECASRFELNTGFDDSVRFISAGLGKIFIGTSTSEWKLPTNFSAVSNFDSDAHSNYGSIDCESMKMNSSFFFIQRGNIIRELYLDNSYLSTADVTALNHDIMAGKIVDTVCVNSPNPTIYVCMDDGRLIHVMYERDAGLNSIAEWYSGDGTEETKAFSFMSLASIVHGTDTRVMVLVEDKDGKSFICHFDESTEDYCDIVGEEDGSPRRLPYETKVETVYAEVNNQNLVFGRFKKAKGMFIRPYRCGHIQIGNDERQLNRTNYALGNDDYYSPILGNSRRQFSMVMKSCGNEPMNILAIAWEVDDGN